MLRGSYGTGFLPPTVLQVLPGASNLGATTVIDPRRGNTTTAVPIGQVLTGGNPNVSHEKSKSWSAGAVLTPRVVPGLRVSADYTRIDKTNNIQTLTVQQVVDNESYLPGRIIRGPSLPTDQPGWAGPVSGINATLTNAAKAHAEAYDVAFDYHPETDVEAFPFFTAATRGTHHQ